VTFWFSYRYSVSNYKIVGGRLVFHGARMELWHLSIFTQYSKSCVIAELDAITPYLVDTKKKINVS
jgi:hypothetical protein